MSKKSRRGRRRRPSVAANNAQQPSIRPEQTVKTAEELKRLNVPDRLIAQFVSQSVYAGPIPPPAMLEEFDRIAPGAAAKLIEQFVKQSDHRMELEKYTIRGDNHRSWAGLVCGFVVAISFGVIAAYVTVNGHPTVGGILGTLDLVSLVGIFVLGRKSQRAERERKASLATSKK